VTEDKSRENAEPGEAGRGPSAEVPAQDPSRRAFVLGGAALGAAGVVAGRRGGKLTGQQHRLIEAAASVRPTSKPTLNDIEHVVILMQENRSFDHYFGTLSGVRGFSDPNVLTQTVNGQNYPIWDQFGYQPGTGVVSNG
jgi:phospholipase C